LYFAISFEQLISLSMNREILRLAIPNILSNISVPLLSTVDTALMGRLTEDHIGAVGLGAMIFNFIYWNFGFLRMGTTGITAQAYGRADEQALVSTLGRALLIGFVLAVGIMVLQQPFLNLSGYLLNVPDSQQGYVGTYFFIRIWAAPATLALYSLLGWFFGMQNAIYPLILTLVINVANMALSYYLVANLGWEVEGVAWGTVASQYIGFFVALGMIRFRYWDIIRQFQKEALLAVEAFSRFLKINSDIFIRTVCLTFAFGFFYSKSAVEGATILAANVILLQYLNWMSYGADGFAYAAESLVGKYAGAKDASSLDRVITKSFIWGMGLAVLFSLAYGMGGNALLSVFTDQADVIDAAQPYLLWMVVLPLIGLACYIWDGIYIGLTASRAMRDTMLISLAIYLIAYYSLSPTFGNHGLWGALLIFLGARGLVQWVYFRRLNLAQR